MLTPPGPVEPTAAHVAAVERFPIILTTNCDQLFEQACEMLGLPYAVRTPNGAPPETENPEVTIFKIDGSMGDPKSLVLSPNDAQRAREDGPFWAEVAEVLQTAKPIVMGHSLRDMTSRSLMSRRNRDLRGVYVAPQIDPVDGRLLLDGLNLEGIESSASDYLWKQPS